MKTIIRPTYKNIDKALHAPASKPETQRALLLSLLSVSDVNIFNASISSETRAMFSALEKLGLSGSLDNKTRISSSFYSKKNDPTFTAEVNASNSALVARCVAWLALAMRGEITIDVGENLSNRPFKPLFEQLLSAGGRIEFPENDIFPFKVHPPQKHSLVLHIDRSISSQFVTAPIFYTLASGQDIEITTSGRRRSDSYIAQTIDIAKRFGANIEYYSNSIFVKKSNLKCNNFYIGTDFTALSYYISLLFSLKGRMSFRNYYKKSLQGERKILDIFKDFGGVFVENEDTLSLYFDRPSSHYIEIDLGDAPNISPTVMAMAALRPGKTKITGMGITAHHKSSRVHAMHHELRKLGVNIDIEQNNEGEYDEATIVGGPISINEPVHDHSDHRVYMALFTLLQAADRTSAIEHADTPFTSNEQFFSDMRSCDLNFEINNQ